MSSFNSTFSWAGMLLCEDGREFWEFEKILKIQEHHWQWWLWKRNKNLKWKKKKFLKFEVFFPLNRFFSNSKYCALKDFEKRDLRIPFQFDVEKIFLQKKIIFLFQYLYPQSWNFSAFFSCVRFSKDETEILKVLWDC